MRDGQGTRTGKERNRQGQRKGTWKKTTNRYGIVLHLFITLHFFYFFYLGTLNGMEGRCMRKIRDTHREGKESTRTKEGHVEEDYQQVRNYFAFVYHTSFLLFLLFRNTQWDGTTMQEKNKGHAQGKEGINSDKGSTSGRRL